MSTKRSKKPGTARMPTTRQIGKRLRELREYRGLSQSELSRQTDVAQNLISEYEAGKARMHAARLARLVITLGGSVDELLGIREVKPRNPAKTLSRTVQRRAELIEDLPEFTQRHVLRTIDLLLKGSDAEQER